MKIHKGVSLIVGSIVLVICGVLFYRVNISKLLSFQKADLENNVISQTDKKFVIDRPISRERIKVGEKFLVKEGQILESTLMFTSNKEKEITITSVKHVYLQDVGNGHTLFQGCYIVPGGYTCALFLLNNFDQLVQLTPTVQYDFGDGKDPSFGGKDYVNEIDKRIKLDVANSVSKDFFVRPNEAPYVYQMVQCGDATTGSACSVIGLNPDRIDPKIGISRKYLASYGVLSTFGLNAGGKETREQKISRSLYSTTTILFVREESEEDFRTKHVSIFLSGNTGEQVQLFESNEDLHTQVKLDYDYINLADTAYLYIGTKKFTYQFSTNTFTEVVR